MNHSQVTYKSTPLTTTLGRYGYLLRAFFGGLLLPFGFAPFHLPGLSILGIALLFATLQAQTLKQSFLTGFVFGLAFLGFGVSWVYVSIHDYGHLNAFVSAIVTLVFIIYLAFYFSLVAMAYQLLSKHRSWLFKCTLFSALWCLGEYLRSTMMGGFPWLLLGSGQIDTPLKYLLPIIGIYGVGFLACLAATCLTVGMQTPSFKQRYRWLVAFVILLLAPIVLKNQQWTSMRSTPLSVGIIQANLSMRDKWDESLFWTLVNHYKERIDTLMGKTKLIVMPESAIPLPTSYLSDLLDTLNQQATEAGSALLLGIPQPSDQDENRYYNALITLGRADGYYLKQHLVPFGEFIPKPFEALFQRFGIPAANLTAGKRHQPLIHAQNNAIATLICYELAYPALLRQQLPEAALIVSISDDGWFGHSLAMYQQLQLSQLLSMQTGRYQVVANNDGLSSVINNKGEIIASLPAFSAGVLEASVLPATGASPWVYLGDTPILLMSAFIGLVALLLRLRPKI